MAINVDRNLDSWPANDKIYLSSEPMQNAIIYGTMYGPQDSDPQYMWDSASFNYALNVWEGLFAYNLSDPDVPLIPRLATDFGTWSGSNLTLNLRQGVDFHSGTHFNATSVKFSLDRLAYLCNFTGTQAPGDTVYGVSIIAVLYQWPDGTVVINSTEIIDEYTVKIILNRAYGVLLPLLTFTASSMMDPSITPAEDYICEGMSGATSETVSGTGPWKFQYYTSGIEAKFVRNDDYWRGAGEIETLIFSVIQDSDARNSALLAGDVNILLSPHPSYYQEMRDSTAVTLYEAGSGTITQYLGFNNKLYNKTWRSAMSYAIDYDYMIAELLEGEAVRLKSPVPLGIQFANWSFEVPVLDLTVARGIMNGMGFGTGFTQESEWIAQAGSSPFLTVNFTYNLGNKFREDMFVLLGDNLEKIGILVEDSGQEWGPYLDLLYNRGGGGWDALSIWFIGWMPDYNDPSNYVSSLMSNVSSSNSAQINDPILEAYMLDGLEETDQNVREQIYNDLQQYVVEELRPWAFGYVSRNHDAWVATMTGFPSNGMGYAYFYPCVWNITVPLLPEPFSILSDADDPDFDGNFNITWTPSTYADNYSLYIHSSLITEINGSLTLLLDEVTDTSYEATGYSSGTYYFVVVARNGNGDTMSSNIMVNIDLPDPPSPFILSSDAGSPDVDGDFNLTWIPSTFADNYSLYVYSSLITEINGSLTLLLDEVTELSYQEFNYAEGTYFFVVVAKNAYGVKLSNNIEVIVEIDVPEPEPGIPGFEMLTMLFIISSICLISLLRKKKKITL